MEVSCRMTLNFTDHTPRSFVILHVVWEIFCRMISMLLIDITETFCLNKMDVLLTYFLLTIIFGVASCRKFCRPYLLTLEVQFSQGFMHDFQLLFNSCIDNRVCWVALIHLDLQIFFSASSYILNVSRLICHRIFWKSLARNS